ncbi:hypothetical protein TNCV_1357621 [Trichonephila clavipes]|uniref:Uncharacterized protein n=1 Tax=Trichonephila clavipes TaxID=2585209 RepID=A0A8X6S9V8_TRICX|nr:hypothetical protein TNCV_1357621 [Trichonephila clavipes]
MPSSGFEPRPYGTAVSVTNHSTVWFENDPRSSTVKRIRVGLNESMSRELLGITTVIASNGKKEEKSVPQQENPTTTFLLDWDVVQHAAYSPELAPSVYPLSGPMASHLENQAFSEVEDVRK